MPASETQVECRWFFIVLAVVTMNANAEVYRWTDADGRVHFGDKPPVSVDSQSVDIRVNSYTSPEVIRQSVATDGSTPGGKAVVMYSATWCGICKRAATYFKENKIPFRDYDVENTAKGRADYKRLGGRAVPIILVGEARMNGFSPASFQQLYTPQQ